MEIEIVNEELLIKGFLYGGLRGNKHNVSAQINTLLSPTEKLPYFRGYPNTYSVISENEEGFYIEQVNFDHNHSDAVIRKVRGCNNVYVKFLNSLGGYSYWMFENYTDDQKNTPSGIINNHVTFDLGSKYESELELYSKVPKKFMPLIMDIIISPEIYIYDLENDEYTKVYPSGNSIEYLPSKEGQKVKIKLKPFNNYNPQRIWQ